MPGRGGRSSQFVDASNRSNPKVVSSSEDVKPQETPRKRGRAKVVPIHERIDYGNSRYDGTAGKPKRELIDSKLGRTAPTGLTKKQRDQWYAVLSSYDKLYPRIYNFMEVYVAAYGVAQVLQARIKKPKALDVLACSRELRQVHNIMKSTLKDMEISMARKTI